MTGAPSKSPRQVACPGCGKPSHFTPENPFRPFCCARCKEGDFGAWASERYRVATSASPTDEPEPGIGQKPA